MKTVVAAALGECVHVAGVSNFLNLAEIAGWRTVFLGPAIPIDQVLKAARDEKADMVGVSYRLTPENGELLLGQFAEEASDLRASGVRFVFGGTPPVAERVKSIGFFERVFDGSEKPEAVLAFLKGQVGSGDSDIDYPQKTMERMNWKSPYPLLRHHFGLPTMESTIKGIELIALAKTLDIISLGIDQDAQENFFHSERQDLRRKGAGGVPVRTVADYQALYAATRMGNYPLLRTYSGTDDFIRLAELYVQSINIAWCAIPLFWFNQMDGRGPWGLEGSIREHQRLMTWYGEHNIPVELNEPHHWGMRDAPDVVFVVSAFLSAYNAKKFGVHDYIVQMMFNSPPGTSDAMDLAKMLAILELIKPLSGSDFHILKQTRTGLLSYPLDPEEALGHMAASIYLQMTLHPDIVHIVGHTEANHAATAEDVITASKVARRAIENAVRGAPNFKIDPIVQTRKEELISEAHITLDAIHKLVKSNVKDPWADPATLAKAVTSGILDAPQLKNNRFGRGTIQSKIIKGMCLSVDPSGKSINEKERLSIIKKEEE
jgi:methylmalonyl-CoA mutase cobalamin-binding subunit